MFFNFEKPEEEERASGRENKFTNEDLREMQRYSLWEKKRKTMDLIRELDNYSCGNWYVSFSGGKDSEVAVDMCARYTAEQNEMAKARGLTKENRKLTVCHIYTGLEYMSVHSFVQTFCQLMEDKYHIRIELVTLYPEKGKRFIDTLTREGYPLISKEVSAGIAEARKGLINGDGTYQYRFDKLNGVHKDKNGKLSPYNMPQYKPLVFMPVRISDVCCDNTKKEPAKLYEKKSGRIPLIATSAEESRLRRSKWLIYGCNAFDSDRPTSAPFSVWKNNDFLTYIHDEKLPIAPPYGEIVPVNSTGVAGQMNMFDQTGYEGCQYCTTGCDRTGCLYCLFGITQDTERIARAQEIEPKRTEYVLRGGCFDQDGYLVPTKEGLGYAFILDWMKDYLGFEIPYKKTWTETTSLYQKWKAEGSQSPLDRFKTEGPLAYE